MNILKPFSSILLVFSIVIFPLIGYATDLSALNKKPFTNPAIESVLQSEIDAQESVELQSIIESDLETSYPGKEKVVLWTVLGGTYWSSRLSILTEQAGKWLIITTQDLGGIIPGLDAATSDGIIVVNAKVPGPDDPVCCPTLQKTLKYRYAHGQIIELK